MTLCLVKGTMYNLQTFLGDSGVLSIGNIPTDKPNYVLYMEIHGKEDVIKQVTLNGADNATIEITTNDTTTLGVGQWPYGVKLCSGKEEDTYIPDLRIAQNALFIVNKQIAEGKTNGL